METNIIKRVLSTVTLLLVLFSTADGEGLFNYKSASKQQEVTVNAYGNVAGIDLQDYKDAIKEAFASSDDYLTDVYYMHMYFVDKDGKTVDDNGTPVISMDGGSFKNLTGQYNWNTTNTSSANGFFLYAIYNSIFRNYNTPAPLYEFSMAKPADKDWADIKAVCVLSGQNGFTIESNAVKSENDLKIALVISFKEQEITFDYKGISNKTETTYIVDDATKAGEITINLADYKAQSSLLEAPGNSSLRYLHWYLVEKGTDGTESVVDNLTTGAFTPPTGIYPKHSLKNEYGYFAYVDYSTQTFGYVSDLKFKLNADASDASWDWSKYKAVCVVSDDITDIKILGDYIVKEPEGLKFALVIDFQKDFAADNTDYTAVTNSVTVTGNETAGTDAFAYSTDEKKITINLSKDNTEGLEDVRQGVRYVRWFLEKDGEAVEFPAGVTLSGTGLKAAPIKSYGQYWYAGADGEASTTALDGITIQGQAVQSLVGYTLVCVMSKDAAGVTEENGEVTHEPDWGVKYSVKFTFNLPFSIPKLATGGVEKHFVLDVTSTSEILIGQNTSAGGFSIDKTVDLLNTINGNTDLTQNGLSSNGYVRWYMLDGNGEVVSMSSDYTYAGKWRFSPSGQSNASPLGKPVYNKETNMTDYGTDYDDHVLRWYSEKGGSLQNALLPTKLSYYGVDPETCGNVIVCEITDEKGTVVTGSGISASDYDDGFYKVRYVFHFSMLASNATSGDYRQFSRNVVFDPDRSTEVFKYEHEVNGDRSTVTVNLSKDEDFQKVIKSGKIRYARWFFVDENGNEIAEYDAAVNVTNGITFTEDSKKQYGTYWYSTTAGTEGIDGVTITGNGSTLIKYRVACALSSELKNIRTDGNGGIVVEPDWEVLYYINFTEPSDFRHYSGYAYHDYEEDKVATEWASPSPGNYQKVHEWEYDVYVKPGGTIDLDLPIVSRGDQSGFAQDRADEPDGYYRWYDYNTDRVSDRVKINKTRAGGNINNSTLVKYDDGLRVFDDEEKDGPYWGDVAPDYTAPADNSWEGDDIACDVSRYLDGGDMTDAASGNSYFREPTLSVRYIFHIRPASEIADKLKEAIEQGGGNVYEAKGYITLGLNDSKDADGFNKGTTNLRVNLHDVDDYFFYDYRYSNKVAPESITDADFGSELYNATKFRWFVHDATGCYSKEITGDKILVEDGKMAAVSLASISGAFSLIEGAAGTDGQTKEVKFQSGDLAYIIAYAADDDGHMCPVASCSIRFRDGCKPMSADDASIPEYRTVAWLEKNYKEVARIHFDTDSKGASYSEPSTPVNNMTSLPSTWARRHYGFVYPGLYSMSDNNSLVKSGVGLACLHGEYGIYKSANMTGVSVRQQYINAKDENGEEQAYRFLWYDGGLLRDRTYALTNGAQSGYFLYVDASEEARPLASADFEGRLCVGSTLVLSAAVADMTSGSSKPQLMFKLYGVELDAEGNVMNEKLIHSFASGSFDTVMDKYSTATWYQVYGKIFIRENTGVENYDHFLVEVDNYCNNTSGADYAIDDIRFYIRNANVEVTQNNPLCEDNGGSSEDNGTVDLRILHETLLAHIGTIEQWTKKSVQYQICTMENGTPVPVKGVYGGGDDEEYGTVDFLRTVPDDDADYKVINYDTYFTIARNVKLPAGKTYYVRMRVQTSKEGVEPVTYGEWGDPGDACSIFSNYFTIDRQTIEITDGNASVNPDLIVPCGSSSAAYELNAQMKVPDPVNGGQITLTGGQLLFDWFAGTKADYGKATDEAGTSLQQALSAFRAAYPEATSYDQQTSETGYTEVYKAALKFFIETSKPQKLYLGTSKIKHDFTSDDSERKSHYFYLVPVMNEITIGGITYQLCLDGQEVELGVVNGGPELTLGFADVTYPEGTTRSVRLGLEQLKDIRNNGRLRIPVNSFKHIHSTKDTDDGFYLAVPDDNNDLTVSKTNDPTWPETLNIGTAELLQVVSTGNDGSEKKDTYVDITLDKAFSNGSYEMHEGYWYEVAFQFEDSKYAEENPNTECCGDAFFTLKIVPEFITWTGEAVDGGSTNWNNDENWTRSTGAELYKKDNVDYGTEGGYSALSQQKSYVPMKFSKVTVPVRNNFRYPYLSDLDNTTLASGLVTASSLVNGDSYTATENIQYDLMVRIFKELTADCQSSHTYDCEKFYGNTCQQIYFKPDAELRSQQFLVYDSAWVEKELVPDKWYMLTSPLKGVYAGDMYVPVSNGRQETEAFQPVVFEENGKPASVTLYDGTVTTYSRNKYPIYQRSWDRTSQNYVKMIDADGDKYEAAVKYDGWSVDTDAETEVTLSQWSHVYNQMDTWQWYSRDEKKGQSGFSLKAGLPNTDYSGKTLIRMPKADTNYYYYSHDDKRSSQHVEVAKIKEKVHDTDEIRHGKLLLGRANGSVATRRMVLQDIMNSSDGNELVLLGNPYMNSLDMTKFFDNNPNLERKLWTVVEGEVKAVEYPKDAETSSLPVTIAPMQSFLVKRTSSEPVTADESVLFTTNMTTNTPVYFTTASAPGAQSVRSAVRSRASVESYEEPRLMLTAVNAAGRSTAEVIGRVGADNGFVDSEDVEMLHDSNLENAPSLYTVAGTEAVSINALADIDMLPLGIVSSSEDETSLTIAGAGSFTMPLYLFDAVSGSSVELGDTAVVSVKANAHGRYYLTSRVPDIASHTSVSDIHCYTPQSGLIVVTSTAEPLARVEVYALGGKLLRSVSTGDVTSCSIRVPRGIYVVHACTAAAERSVKIKVN